MIELGEWLPDQPTISSPGVYLAKNVIPAARGYRPWLKQAPVSSSTSSSTASASGLFSMKAEDLSVALYMGDVADLYKYNTATRIFDVKTKTGSTYATGAEERWRFAAWKGNVFATNFSDTLQYATASSTARFIDAPGSPPKVKFLAVIANFLVGAYTDTGGTIVPWQVRWSAIDNPFSWTIGTDQADQQDIPDIGVIRGLSSGQVGYVLGEKGIRRMAYMGAPDIFQVETVFSGFGCDYAGSVAQIGDAVFFASRIGFHMITPGGLQNIGAEKVNKWWLRNLNEQFAYRMQAAIDPVNQLYVLAYPGTDSPTGRLNRLIMFAYTVGKWSFAEVDIDALASVIGSGVSGDSLDSYALPDVLDISPDSSFWQGGARKLGGIASRRLVTFDGAAAVGSIETGDAEINARQFSTLNRVYPIADGTVTVEVAARARMADSVVYSTATAMNASGFAPTRSTGRYHRARLTLTDWTQALGLDLDAKGRGLR